MKLTGLLLVLIISFSLLGCSANVKTFDSTATMGEQMKDLDASYQAGAITEDEYNKAKKVIMNKYK